MGDFLKNLVDGITKINTSINDFIWVKIGIILLISVGVVMTVVTKFFQVSHIRHWWQQTIGGVFKKNSAATAKLDNKSISQFQALCTALAATIGTGNIAGVSAAIVFGGPGAVFWMWIAAFFGMMTNFSENVLGIYYRRKNSKGEWCGGAMYYLEDGLGSVGYKDSNMKFSMKKIGKILAILFAIFAILASFGIGNMGQVNKIVTNLNSAFFSGIDAPKVAGISIVNIALGVMLIVLAGLIIIGGLQRIAAFAEKIVPFMSVAYIIGAIVIVAINYSKIGAMFVAIFKCAFGVKAAGGAVIGEVIKQGCKRGVFSNEAGLGSSVMVHSSSNVKEPVKQGMWGVFEVFFDTFIVCTITALVVLSSGAINLKTGVAVAGTDDATLVASAFGNQFGNIGEWFIAIAMLLFAFTTVLGWSQYGSKAVEYLLGEKAVTPYKFIFTFSIIFGACMTSSLAWDISDTFNGFMMIPNLIAVLALSPVVYKITKNYVDRKIKGKKDIAPILSATPEYQKEAEQ